MVSTPETTRPPTATIAVVSVAAFLASLDLFIVNIAFPEIRTAFGSADFAAMSWILNGYTVVFAAFLSPAGRLGDRYGHRRIFLAGLAVFMAGSLACGASISFAMLVASRVIQALGAALLTPSSLALLMAAVPASRRAVAVSTWSAVGAMAAALGPPIGGLLVDLNWRWIFLVNLPLGLLALATGPRVLKRTASTGTGLPDLFGALSLVVGVAALVWAIVELPTARSGLIRIGVATLVALFALAITVQRSRHHPTPAIDLAAVRVTALWTSCAALVLFAAAFAAMLLGNVMLLTIVWHEPAAVAGLFLSPGPIVVVAVSLTLAGRLINRFGVGAVAAVGAGLYAAGIIVWLMRVGPEPHYFTDFLPGQILTGAGVGLVIPSLSAVSGLALPPHRWGSGSALSNTARQLGTVLGTALLAVVYQNGLDLTAVQHGWQLITVGAAAAAVVGLVLAVTWKPVAD